jgi:hypothetical protein
MIPPIHQIEVDRVEAAIWLFGTHVGCIAPGQRSSGEALAKLACELRSTVRRCEHRLEL